MHRPLTGSQMKRQSRNRKEAENTDLLTTKWRTENRTEERGNIPPRAKGGDRKREIYGNEWKKKGNRIRAFSEKITEKTKNRGLIDEMKDK